MDFERPLTLCRPDDGLASGLKLVT